MSTVRTAPFPPAARTRSVGRVVGLLAVATVLALLYWAVRPPSYVAHLDIVNRSSTPIDVSVAPAGGGGELGLAEAIPRFSTRVEDVVDQGDEWVFRFARASCEPVEQRVSRDRLVASDWRLVIPDRVTAALVTECRYRPPIPPRA